MNSRHFRSPLSLLSLLALLLHPGAPASAAVEKPKVSYFRDIRPIFQANCQGCHQPAKPKGGYVMTDFNKLLAGGEKDGTAIIPGDLHKGSVLEQITPQNGSAEMPKNKPPLPDHELDLIRRWIAEGAHDDTPADAKKHFDADHPPVYSQRPVISSLDFSPDGALMAVAGFHEVLLHKADGSGIVARLVGLSERIQSVRFSPDGRWLAAAGGDPARLGELQVWEVETRKLKNSVTVSWDTLYGVSWSPDSRLIAFGCADNSVRAVEAASGKQVLQMGSHNDWVLDTTFSLKGDHLISVGRDMTAKLNEIEHQRFVDNITSITPGALRGGMHAVERHPSHDAIVVGGSDGIPQLFRIFRTTARKIGDNANLIKKYPEMAGRVFSTRFSKDGSKFVAGSALNGQGEVSIFAAAGDFSVPEEIKIIQAKDTRQRTEKENARIKEFESVEGKRLSQTPIRDSAIYTVAFHPDGQRVAASGSDGKIKLIDAATGAIEKEFDAAPLSPNQPLKKQAANPLPVASAGTRAGEETAPEKAPREQGLVAIEFSPSAVTLMRRNDYAQLLITAKYQDGSSADITRFTKLALTQPVAEITPRGQLHPKADGNAELQISFGTKTAVLPVRVQGAAAPFESDFIRDVNPAMTKMGCNQGSCHGAKDGKAGFKLSLRGYDPEYDIRSLTDDLASRRVVTSSPDDSLMLLKAVAEVPHEGGRKTRTDEKYYQILREWIASGASLKSNSPRVIGIELSPSNPVVQAIGSQQQFRVTARYADGSLRDVTNEAFIESGNTDVASVDPSALVTTIRRGEAPLLARFEGNYVATTLTVMGDRSGFRWNEPITWNRIDNLVAAKWKRMQIEPSDLAADNEFLRRVTLDLTGMPPTAEKLRAFLADPTESRKKRDAVIDELIGSPDFIEHWTNKWSDLLQVNTKFLANEGAVKFRSWIRQQIEQNTPYDQFVRTILTATGSNKDAPAASYWKILRQPTEAMENTTHLFLATRFNCNKCHDHPFERWTQDQYYETAAYFAQFTLAPDPASGGKNIPGTAVESAKALYEIVKDNPGGEVKHDRTGKITAPQFPYPAKAESKPESSRREKLADWVTSPDNRYFASSYVNRIWGYLLGRGIIEPLDDIRAGNPPSNPELLEHLTQEFLKSNFNTREVFRMICKSRTYQLSIKTNRWNNDDEVNYSHAIARRLPAEVLFDSVFKVTGAKADLPGVGAGGRAALMVDSSSQGPAGFLATLGKPARESTCECERSSNLGLGSVMAFLSGPVVSSAIQDPKNQLTELVSKQPEDTQLIQELFQRVLSRDASTTEIEATQKIFASIDADSQNIQEAWAAKEKEQAPIIAKMEMDRQNAIAAAKGKLDTYEAETKNLREERETVRKEREARAVAAVRGWESALPQRIEGWIAANQPASEAVRWTQLRPKTAGATGQVKLSVEKDGSVLSSGGNNATDYTITLDADMKDVTGILLEVLPDASLPLFGPGRTRNANFILSEFILQQSPVDKPAATVRVNFSKAKASHASDKYPVEAAIDGKDDDGQNGWSIGGQSTRRHWAAFQLDAPIETPGTSRLTFRLVQRANENLLGKIRLYVTRAPSPLKEGVREEVAEAAALPPAQRTEPQKAMLAEALRLQDAEYWRLRREESEAKVPLAPDPRHTEMKDALAKVSEPIRLDPVLVQLREDAKSSKQQTGNKRLTVVQDLTWALINNPAFLFNR